MLHNSALDGITVLDISRLLPGPFCSMILADHGARVIRVEDRRFEAEAEFTSIINRNKEHITLNLKAEEGKEIFFKLAENADVILEGFRPGVVADLGIDYDSIRRINPAIIYCSITGYGQTGPCRNEAGHDINYLAVTGVLDLVGEKGKPPAIPGVQIADIAGGAHNAAIGILLALFKREKSGKGQFIDISMADGAFSMNILNLHLMNMTGVSPERSDSVLSHRYACYNTYETADGKYIAVGALENRFWENLCDVMNAPRYAGLQFDEKRREEIIDFMRTTFLSHSLSEWERRFKNRDVCCTPVKSLEEAMDDSLMMERGMTPEITGRDGKPSKTIGTPVRLGRTPGRPHRPPPSFGQHTASVLAELGYDTKTITDLRNKKVI